MPTLPVRSRWFVVIGAAAAVAAGAAMARAARAQDQPPERRDVTVTAKDFRFSPNRIDASRDQLLRLTVKSEDVAYGFTIDDYRVSKRVPAGGSVVLELRLDREGTFPFYSNMTSDARHAQMRGELVVRRR
jgi:heme/copper-type cytochrome/quinol oxidase subunit 2